jgi:hypothetical protein
MLILKGRSSGGGGAASPIIFTAEGAGAGGDPYYKNVALLLNFTGSNGSTTFSDESPNPKTLTAVGNASIQSNALALDGNGDYVTLTPATNDLSLVFHGGRPFTIDGELNIAGSGNREIIGYNNNDAAGANWWDIYLDNSRNIVFRYNANTNTYTSTSAMPVGTNSHFEISFDGTTSHFFIDGNEAGSVDSGILSFYKRGTLAIGANLFGGGYEQYFNGSFNFLRITPDVARHTSGFTPPSGTLPAYAGQITGTITANTSGVSALRVTAYDAATGRKVGSTTTTTSTFTIPCDDVVACVVTVSPRDVADYGAFTPVSYGPVTPS